MNKKKPVRQKKPITIAWLRHIGGQPNIAGDHAIFKPRADEDPVVIVQILRDGNASINPIGGAVRAATYHRELYDILLELGVIVRNPPKKRPPRKLTYWQKRSQ